MMQRAIGSLELRTYLPVVADPSDSLSLIGLGQGLAGLGHVSKRRAAGKLTGQQVQQPATGGSSYDITADPTHSLLRLQDDTLNEYSSYRSDSTLASSRIASLHDELPNKLPLKRRPSLPASARPPSQL